MNKRIFRLLIMVVLCCPLLESGAQPAGDIRFSFKGKRIVDKDTVLQGSTINVDVFWYEGLMQKMVFDSACVVYKLTPEEQKRTGRTEKLVRDSSFVPHKLTPEELKNRKYSFSVKPKRTIVYFYTFYFPSGKTAPWRTRINVIDKNGKEIK